MEPILRARDDGIIELVHHGIKGQKWGVENGPPYPLDDEISTGKRLRDKEEQIKRVKVSDKGAKKIRDSASFRQALLGAGALSANAQALAASDEKTQKEYKSLAKSLTDSSGKISEEAQKEIDDYYKRQLAAAKTMVDLDDFPDDVIRQRVNRIQLEKQYKDLVMTDYESGQDKVKKTLQSVAGLISIVSAGAALALTIKKLKE